MHGNIGVLSRDRSAELDAMVHAYWEHCQSGESDFLEHLKDWHMSEALGAINDAAQKYTPQAAIVIIKRELDKLIEIGADAHREKLKWEGIE